MTNAQDVFKKVLRYGSILILGTAVITGVLGLVFASIEGLVSALIGTAMALVFVSLTAFSVWFGSRLSLGGFFGVVLGGWVVKLAGFMALVYFLRGASFIVGWVLFVAVVMSVIGSLAVDATVVLRSRIPTFEGK